MRRHAKTDLQTYIHTYIHAYIHTDRQTDIQTDRQTDRQPSKPHSEVISGRVKENHWQILPVGMGKGSAIGLWGYGGTEQVKYLEERHPYLPVSSFPSKSSSLSWDRSRIPSGMSPELESTVSHPVSSGSKYQQTKSIHTMGL